MTQVQQGLPPDRAAMLKQLREHGSVPGGLVRQACAWAVNEVNVQARAYRELADGNERMRAGRENAQRINDNSAREIDRLRALSANLLTALNDVLPLLEECDCIYSDRADPLCPCRAARALCAQQHDPEQQPGQEQP